MATLKEEQGLIARVAAAVAGRDAEAALSAALGVLRGSGIEPIAEPSRGAPWLAVEVPGRRLGLAAPREELEASTRETLGHLLTVALTRRVELDECRRLAERAELLSAASFEGLFIHEEGVIVDANQRFAEITGYAPSELFGGVTLMSCVAPEDVPDVQRRMREGFEGAYVITGVRKNGERIRVELQSKQSKLGAKPVRVVAVRDVTERERHQALLRESEQRLRNLASEAFDFLVISRDGVAVEVNGPLQEVLGFAPSEWLGRPLVELVVPASGPLVSQILAERRTGTYEITLVSKSGEQIPCEVVAIMSTLDGQPVRVAAVRDLRELRRLEQERRRLQDQLAQSQRLESLGVLAGGVAHDFNNLLVGVLGNAELLHDSLGSEDDRQLCEGIISAAQRAADLTAQLLAYAGRRELGHREPVDLAALLEELCTLLGARLSASARLQLRLEGGSVVLGDRPTLMQMLMNLVTNASDALAGKPGTIELRTRRVREPDARFERSLGAPVAPGDWVLVEIADTGIGMDPATLSRVFEPFFSTKEQCHGLGLASCLGIVSSHGGALTVESEPGRGSRFSVLLPAASRTLSGPPEPPASLPKQPGKVLVVDDEPVVRALLRRCLERRGFAVREAPNGRAGLAVIREGWPDLVVLDINMPDLNGADVVEQARADGLTLPILITSGHMDESTQRRLHQSCYQGFLRKPFSSAELLDAIEKALEEHRA